jgi:tRNA A-37 threonylcarbamoyl transferase component Bud32
VTRPIAGAPREPVDLELLARADRAEQTGDARGAAESLRALVDRHPEDVPTRLRFARVLVAAGHGAAARRALAPLDIDRAPPAGLEADVHRAFALLDEAEGALAAAAERWERILADDLDDAEALTHLAALRPSGAPARVGVAETLVSPDGLEALRYRLRRELGRGATAAVYLATDETLGIDVALKVLHPQLAGAGHAEARRRFFAEGRLAASTRHRGVVAIYDVDEAARVLTMELIAGGTLRARLAAARGAPLPSTEIAATSASLLEALAFVHERGILHGDLKPSNLLVRAPGDVVLADFGAAQLRGEA